MQNHSILIVDDEENMIMSFLRLFREDNYEISTASNGKDGLELVKKDKFHLVISDYRMPEMNGIEFLEQVRNISPDSIRMIFTAYADLNVAVSAINEGNVHKFLEKAWGEKILKIQVKNALELYDLLLEKQALNKEIIEKNKELEEINKNLEKIVEERTQQLLQSEKIAALGKMASQIGHEINNILSILVLKMDMIEIKNEDCLYIKESLKIFSEQYDRLRIHTNNLLTLGKPIPVEFKNINIRDVLERIIDILIDAGILKFYTIRKEYEEHLFLIYGDDFQIEQVFTNLFINAHHAMNRKGKLYIENKMSDDKKFVEVHVKDTGKGIPEENLEKIFKPFFTTKPEWKGTGLGLFAVKKIVEAHKGYINVKSHVNVGTTMIVGFPILQSN